MHLSSYPQAIAHLDADAFFASVEQALHPKMRGKPVVTGAERGMVIALSYEAKALGIKRGMTMWDAKRICPKLIMCPGDYESYGLFSQRIFEIMRRFTPQVEEYSIDEAFADLTGLKRLHHMSYPEICEKMKRSIEAEVGITVSIGLSVSKSLAKLASKFRKPSGLVSVPVNEITQFLAQNTIDKVWGIGNKSEALLSKYGVKTVLDFVRKPQALIKELLGKTGVEIWNELSGKSVYAVDSREKTSYQSISKFKTFTPPSTDAEFMFAQLLRNLEGAWAKMRRYNLATSRAVLILRPQDFQDASLEITLSKQSVSVLDLVSPIKNHFEKLFVPHKKYRATGIVLCDLKPAGARQMDIFEDAARVIKLETIDNTVQQINAVHGRRTLHLADSLAAKPKPETQSRAAKLGLAHQIRFLGRFRIKKKNEARRMPVFRMKMA